MCASRVIDRRPIDNINTSTTHPNLNSQYTISQECQTNDDIIKLELRSACHQRSESNPISNLPRIGKTSTNEFYAEAYNNMCIYIYNTITFIYVVCLILLRQKIQRSPSPNSSQHGIEPCPARLVPTIRLHNHNISAKALLFTKQAKTGIPMRQ